MLVGRDDFVPPPLLKYELLATGVNADVYPIIILGKDAFSIVPLRANTGTSSAPATDCTSCG